MNKKKKEDSAEKKQKGNQTKAKQKKRKEKERKLTWESSWSKKKAGKRQPAKEKKKKKGKEGLQAHKASKASKPNRPASPAHLCPLTNCMPCFCTALHMIMALWSPKKRGVFFFSFLDSSSSRWRGRNSILGYSSIFLSSFFSLAYLFL